MSEEWIEKFETVQHDVESLGAEIQATLLLWIIYHDHYFIWVISSLFIFQAVFGRNEVTNQFKRTMKKKSNLTSIIYFAFVWINVLISNATNLLWYIFTFHLEMPVQDKAAELSNLQRTLEKLKL